MQNTFLPQQILQEEEWKSLCESHFARASLLTAAPRKRRDRGESHPVEDFLFNYYPYPISLIEQWHPGFGTGLRVDTTGELPPRFRGKFYSITNGLCFVDPEKLSGKHRDRLIWINELLIATESRPPNFACHGLHEWAMVYRAEEIRHASLAPLRIGQKATDELVESRAITCTHHDAFRFFAQDARPLNRIQPTMDTRILNEQPGCVHANMDLYKWAAKSMPWIGSDLLLETFILATRLRDLDMRASPYDLRKWNVSPVRIETTEGRREYEREQKELAGLASGLRGRLIMKLAEITKSR